MCYYQTTTKEHFSPSGVQYNVSGTVDLDANYVPAKLKTAAVKHFCMVLVQKTHEVQGKVFQVKLASLPRLLCHLRVKHPAHILVFL